MESVMIARGDEPEKDGRMSKRPGLSWPRRRLDEPCPETIIVMPFAINLCLALYFRKWLRRRIGRRAGTILGNAVMLVFGGPPLAIAYVLVWGLRLGLAFAERLTAETR
jgi:hypothetical protein